MYLMGKNGDVAYQYGYLTKEVLNHEHKGICLHRVADLNTVRKSAMAGR